MKITANYKLILVISALFGALGCSKTTVSPRQLSAYEVMSLGDKTRIQKALGDPDAILALEKSGQACSERWTYSQCNRGPNDILFVDFDETGRVCDYSVASFPE